MSSWHCSNDISKFCLMSNVSPSITTNFIWQVKFSAKSNSHWIMASHLWQWKYKLLFHEVNVWYSIDLTFTIRLSNSKFDSSLLNEHVIIVPRTLNLLITSIISVVGHYKSTYFISYFIRHGGIIHIYSDLT